MKKKLLFLLAFMLICEAPQALARGRYGGGARYTASRSTYHPVTNTTTTRTRSVSSYNTGAYRGGAYSGGVYHGAYRSGAYATNGQVTVAATRRAVGYRAPYLPVGYATYYAAGVPYYYYGGSYYSHDDDGYVVVTPPLGTTVTTLPSGATLVTGKTNVYVYNGVYYRPSYENGAVVYVVSNP